jgi:hypothetical protein
LNRLVPKPLAIALVVACQLATGARGDERIDFARDIQPLLTQHCMRCHGGVKRAGGLLLIPAGGLPAAGDSGQQPVAPGKPEVSEVFRRVVATDADERMPAESEPLAAEEIDKLRRWIEQGADWPTHWSLAPIQAATPPDAPHLVWGRSTIDQFVLARLGREHIEPSPPADRYTLIRRLYFDLTGFPPLPADADEFVADPSPDAYERLVDRLLASPHFGERWGRHWLDLARYADSDGYEVDKPRPEAYRWRDWVIEAVNRDMPLDQFTVEQFAGDLLPEATPMQRLATAYHRQTLTNNEGGVDKEEYRLKAVLDRVSNTGTVWLGLTLACAQCHDHPYDPFTQREFYALAAIVNNAEETELELPGEQRGRRALKFRVLSELELPRTTRLLKRGEFLQPGDEVLPALPALALAESDSEQQPPSRLELARWLVDPANAVTPRVMVNQIWLRLFGQGLVRTSDDFGARGERPDHPELLDWLALELVGRRSKVESRKSARAWSRKGMIRQIVSSATYRQASRRRPEIEAIDPQNKLLARQNRVRAEAEIVRDLHLAAGGLLSSKIGGPSVFPPLGEEFVKITFRSQLPWQSSPGGDRYRRGMYTFFKRSVPYPDLMTFDCPDASVAAVQRPASNTPLQALTLLNSETCLEAARGLAAGLLSLSDRGDEQLVRAAFRTCLTRPPTPSEVSRLVEVLSLHRHWYESHLNDAKALVGDAFGSSGSLSEAAALVATANVIMNLDEFISRD